MRRAWQPDDTVCVSLGLRPPAAARATGQAHLSSLLRRRCVSLGRTLRISMICSTLRRARATCRAVAPDRSKSVKW